MDLRISIKTLVFGMLALAATAASAQYSSRPRAKSAPPTTRAVAVLEWIGPEQKPTASRLVPVSVYVNGHFQDAGLYLSRPEPMALDPGTEYELQRAGTPTAYFDVSGTGKVPADRYDTLWIGLGVWKSLDAVPKRSAHNKSAQVAAAPVDIDDGKPHLVRRPGSESTGTDTTASGTAKPADSGGPVLVRHGSDSGSSGNVDTSGDGNPPDDPDRPHLKRAPEPTAAPAPAESPDAPETNIGKLGDDPDRPVLHHGRPTAGANAEPDIQLKGEPVQMQQRVAVSDAANGDPHSFVYNWADGQVPPALQQKLEDLAQKAIAAAAPPAAAVAAKPVHTAAAHRAKSPAPAPPDNSLQDEKLTSFELSYDAGATLVLSAHTAGEGAALHYVTLVAQVDIYGEPQVLSTSVTDEAHLDQTPQMKLVDAVDADGDNRGELLFELRANQDRQFALYRVYRGAMTQVFVTGTMP
jgi:hypothetical protein